MESTPKLPPDAFNFISSVKLPKNTYHAGKLKDAIDHLQEAPMPNVDLTIKKSKTKPFDLSAIDVGQSYQHINFDHSTALKSTEENDQTNIVQHHPAPSQRPKLHFNQQTYHDINSMGNNRPKSYGASSSNDDDSEDSSKHFKGFYMPKNHQGNEDGGSESLTTVHLGGKKLPRIIKNIDDEERNTNEPVDAPIQIINGIPVANPYNIDLNTLK